MAKMTDLPASPSPTPPEAVKIPAIPLHFKGCPASPFNELEGACTCSEKVGFVTAPATPGSVSGEERRVRITLGMPINKVSTANLITSPAEDVLFDKINEVIDRLNAMNAVG